MWKAGRRISSLHDARPNQNVQNQGNVYSSHCRNNRISGHEWFASRPAFPVYLPCGWFKMERRTPGRWASKGVPHLWSKKDGNFFLQLHWHYTSTKYGECFCSVKSASPNVCIWKIWAPKINSMIVFEKLTISRVPKFKLNGPSPIGWVSYILLLDLTPWWCIKEISPQPSLHFNSGFQETSANCKVTKDGIRAHQQLSTMWVIKVPTVHGSMSTRWVALRNRRVYITLW